MIGRKPIIVFNQIKKEDRSLNTKITHVKSDKKANPLLINRKQIMKVIGETHLYLLEFKKLVKVFIKTSIPSNERTIRKKKAYTNTILF